MLLAWACAHTHTHTHTHNRRAQGHLGRFGHLSADCDATAHIHAHTYMRTHTCAHIHAHTYMHTHMCAHTHREGHKGAWGDLDVSQPIVVMPPKHQCTSTLIKSAQLARVKHTDL